MFNHSSIQPTSSLTHRMPRTRRLLERPSAAPAPASAENSAAQPVQSAQDQSKTPVAATKPALTWSWADGQAVKPKTIKGAPLAKGDYTKKVDQDQGPLTSISGVDAPGQGKKATKLVKVPAKSGVEAIGNGHLCWTDEVSAESRRAVFMVCRSPIRGCSLQRSSR